MQKIEIQIPDNISLKLENGNIVLVENKPKLNYKYKVGEELIHFKEDGTYIVLEQLDINGEVAYKVQPKGHQQITMIFAECQLSKPTVELIATFEEACQWCIDRGHDVYVSAYNVCKDQLGDDPRVKDVLAYLKLRIIVHALNSYQEPTDNGNNIKYYTIKAIYGEEKRLIIEGWTDSMHSPQLLLFKNYKIAEYAKYQFEEIFFEYFYQNQ